MVVAATQRKCLQLQHKQQCDGTKPQHAPATTQTTKARPEEQRAAVLHETESGKQGAAGHDRILMTKALQGEQAWEELHQGQSLQDWAPKHGTARMTRARPGVRQQLLLARQAGARPDMQRGQDTIQKTRARQGGVQVQKKGLGWRRVQMRT